MNHIPSLRKILLDHELNALLLFRPEDIFFFTGFSSSHAIFLVTETKAFFFTDNRYLEAARLFFSSQNSTKTFSERGEKEMTVQNITEVSKVFFEKEKLQRIGVDFHQISYAQMEQWSEKWEVELSDVSVKVLRSQKTKENISCLQKAASIADEALIAVLPLLQVGISEKEFAWELEKAGRERGAEKVSFDAIVAFGEHSAIPHHHPTEKKLQKNTPLLIDWGFMYKGFCSDCTRCFFLGNPDKEWLKTYDRVWEAQKKGMEKMRPKKEISEVQKVAEDFLTEKIMHSFGHGVGVEVHEYPGVSPKTKGEFIANQVVTAEPGLYYSGKFGIRIEDMVHIGKTRNTLLTQVPKEKNILALSLKK